MLRKRLTAQDAFIGVREEEPEAEAPGPEAAPEPDTPEPEVGERPPVSAPRPRKRAKASRDPSNMSDEELDEGPFAVTLRRPGTRAEEQYLENALREVRSDLEARLPLERLTIYLTADVSAELDRLWEEVRNKTSVKVSRSSLATAAVRIVLNEPALRAHAAVFAVQDKARRSSQR